MATIIHHCPILSLFGGFYLEDAIYLIKGYQKTFERKDIYRCNRTSINNSKRLLFLGLGSSLFFDSYGALLFGLWSFRIFDVNNMPYIVPVFSSVTEQPAMG
jgi:hypothetical protein